MERQSPAWLPAVQGARAQRRGSRDTPQPQACPVVQVPSCSRQPSRGCTGGQLPPVQSYLFLYILSQFPVTGACLSLGLSPVFPAPSLLCCALLIPLCLVPTNTLTGWARAKTCVLRSSEVAGPACRGLCCGRKAPGCILAMCHPIPTPNKEHSVGTALPFEVVSVVAVRERALSREMLTQLLPPSLSSPAPIPGLALLLGDRLLSPLQGRVPAQGVQTSLCFGRDGGSDIPSLAVMPPLSLLCPAEAALLPIPWEAAPFPVLDQ